MTMVTIKKKLLPIGWKWVKLEEIVHHFPGAWGEDYEFEGAISVPVISTGNVSKNGALNANDAPVRYLKNNQSAAIGSEGDLFVVKSSGSASNILSGKTAICPADLSGKIACSNFMMKLVPNRDKYNPFLLWLFLNSDQAKEYVRYIAGSSTYPNIKWSNYKDLSVPLPPLSEQQRIAGILQDKLAAVEHACQAAEAQLEAAQSLPESHIRASLEKGKTVRYSLADCLDEIKKGIGDDWQKFRLVGATRQGIAPAKEGVGKYPERYKPVNELSVFYNPMRILLGSIAFIDEGEEPGITSPDYVVLKGKDKILHSRWFYYWFRSDYGMNLINSLSRGAVRERILFNRLSKGEIELPDWVTQLKTAKALKGIDELKQKIQEEIDTINAIPASLHRKAFQGEL